MNTGGVAVLIANLMRSFDPKDVNAKLVTGTCDTSEEDYLGNIAEDIKATRIPTLQRAISPKNDLIAFFALAKEIRKFQDGYSDKYQIGVHTLS
jgi:hypothetical protein